MLDEMFIGVLEMTGAASLVILAVLLLRLFLKKAPKKFSYVLWFVVLFRLLCPFAWEISWGIVPIQRIENYTLAEWDISVVGAAEAAYETADKVLTGSEEQQYVRTDEITTHRVSTNAGVMVDEEHPVYVPTEPWETAILFGKYIWAAGILLMLLGSAVSYGKLRRRLGCSILLRENIYLADYVESPFVVGLLNPKIYLPSVLADQTQEREYIILHEKHHIRRGDSFAKLLAFVALCIHWFNPLVWVAFVLFTKDMEMSCDEAVVEHLSGDDRRKYSASLLGLATGRRIIAGTPLAFGEGDTRDRIRHVMNYKKPMTWVTVMAVMILIVGGAMLLTSPYGQQTRLSAGRYESVEMLYRDQHNTQMFSTRGGLEEGLPLGGTMKQQFYVTSDQHLYRAYKQTNDWEYVGRFETYSGLTNEELEGYVDHEYAPIRGLTTGNEKETLSRDEQEDMMVQTQGHHMKTITDARILYLENDYFCLMFQTKSGDSYLGYGWEDKVDRGNAAKDMTHLKVLYHLKQTGKEAADQETFQQLLSELSKSEKTFVFDNVSFRAEANADTKSAWQSTSLNYDKLSSGTEVHMPIFGVENYAELTAFKEFVLENFGLESNEEGIPSVVDAVEQSGFEDPAFFEEHVLFALYVEPANGEHYWANKGYVDGKTFRIILEEKTTGLSEEEKSGRLFLLYIPREKIEGCTEFDACVE